MVVLEIKKKRKREREIRVSGAYGKRLCKLVGYLENDCTGFLLSVAVSWFSASYESASTIFRRLGCSALERKFGMVLRANYFTCILNSQTLISPENISFPVFVRIMNKNIEFSHECCFKMFLFTKMIIVKRTIVPKSWTRRNYSILDLDSERYELLVQTDGKIDARKYISIVVPYPIIHNPDTYNRNLHVQW